MSQICSVCSNPLLFGQNFLIPNPVHQVAYSIAVGSFIAKVYFGFGLVQSVGRFGLKLIEFMRCYPTGFAE